MALTQVTSAGLKDGEIVNADLHSSAAIALSKLGTSGSAGSGNFLRGDGAWTAISLDALNASNLTSGTVAAARLDTATTQSAGNNSTKIATTAYADTAVSNLVDSAPGALNTLNELAAALGDDANFSTTVTNSIATKLPLAGGTLTGTLTGKKLVLTDDGSTDPILQVLTDDQGVNIFHARNDTYSTDSNVGLKIWQENGGEVTIQNRGNGAWEGIDIQQHSGSAVETRILITANRTVELYNEGTRRFQTTTHGVNITGTDGGGSQVYGDMYWDNTSNAGKDFMWDQSANKLSFADDVKATFGGDSSGGDLQIYHDGTDSYVKTVTNDLVLQSTADDVIMRAVDDIHIQTGSNSDYSIFCAAGGEVSLYHSSNKKFETTSSGANVTGELGINVSSPQNPLHVRNSTDNPTDIRIQRGVGNASNGSAYASIIFDGHSYCGAKISSHRDHGTYDDRGDLRFWSGYGHDDFTERMRIGNDGKFYYGNTSQGPHGGFFNIDASASSTNGINIVGTTGNYCVVSASKKSSGDHIYFSNYSSGSSTNTGRIQDNGSNVSYNTSSDYRIKENIVSISDGITRLKQLNPIRHTFKNNSDAGTVDGWVAHELDTVCPYAVTGEKDAVNEDGTDNLQGVDYGRVTPLLTAALKEAIAKIETLETKVAALEAA